jgi:hypothetical protein
MHTKQLHLPADYGRGPARQGVSLDKYSVAWILFFAAFGFLAISGLSWVVLRFSRFGVLAAVAIVVTVPIALYSAVLAIPQLFDKLAVIRPKLRWWHALLLLLYVSSLVFRVRHQEATQAEPLDAWTLLRIIPEMIVFGWLMVRLYQRRDAIRWLRCLFQGLTGALTTFALVCLASTFWSVYPAWTLFKSLEYLLDISVLAAALANIRSLDDYEDLFNWTWTIFGLELAWVWLQIPLWPSESFVDGRIKGFIPATGCNAVGQSGAFFAVIALCRLFPLEGRRSNTPFNLVLCAFGLVSLLLSQTRNAIGGFVLAAALVLILSRRIWLLVLSSVVGAMTWFLTPLGGIALAYLEREQSSAAMASVTGRLPLWQFAWEQFLQHPLTGMGAYAAGRFYIMSKMGVDPASLHSDWVELLVGTGLAGLIPFLLVIFGTWWFLFRGIYDKSLDPRGRQLALEGIGVLAVITVHSFFNVELIWHVPLLLFVLMGYAEVLRRRRKNVMVPRPLPSILARSSPQTRYSTS